MLCFSDSRINNDFIGSIPVAPQQNGLLGFPVLVHPSVDEINLDRRWIKSGLTYGSTGNEYAVDDVNCHSECLSNSISPLIDTLSIVGLYRSAVASNKELLLKVCLDTSDNLKRIKISRVANG